MPQKTLIKHLVKCPDRPPNYKNCIYNISHVVHAAELEAHEKGCPNRILFDTIIFEPEDMVRPVTIIGSVPSIQYEESWDGMEHSADVLNYISEKTILMKAKHGFTKSERKQHRIFLHEHDVSNFNNLKNGNSKMDVIKNEQLESKEEKHQQKNSTERKKSKRELFIGSRPNFLVY